METAGTSIAVVLLTLALREGVPMVIKFMTAKSGTDLKRAADDRKARREDEEAASGERDKVIAMLQADSIDQRKQIHELRNDANVYATRAAACEAERAQDRERIAALEDALERH